MLAMTVRSIRLPSVVVALLLVLTACEPLPPPTPRPMPLTTPSGPPTIVSQTVPDSGSRTYSLGITPFPHDVTVEAVDAAYAVMAEHADLLAFHSTEGVPWTEAAAATGFPGYGPNLQDKWRRHRAAITANPGHEVYLGLTPLNDARSGLADYWAEAEHLPPPDGFAAERLDSAPVVDAYINYVLSAVEWYEPDYLAIGLEVNLLAKNDPARWPQLVELLNATYRAVKDRHPHLPVFSTVAAVDLLEGWTDGDHLAQRAALEEVLAASDYLALSFHPFASNHLTGPLPDDAFDTLAQLAGGRPMAVAETGYPAQTTSFRSFDFTLEGTPGKQREWIDTVLNAAEQHRMRFVVNFIGRDYDALWRAIGSTDEAAPWRDTGLLDEQGRARPALDRWHQALSIPRQRPRTDHRAVEIVPGGPGTAQLVTRRQPLSGQWQRRPWRLPALSQPGPRRFGDLHHLWPRCGRTGRRSSQAATTVAPVGTVDRPRRRTPRVRTAALLDP